jgi:hypothetical protein
MAQGTDNNRMIVGRDACRLGIAPRPWWNARTARYPETTRGIAPYKTARIRTAEARWHE